MSPVRKRLVLAVLALIFVALTLVLLGAGLRLTFDDRDYWIGFVGLCVLLEIFYLALHFSLKTIYFRRPAVVTRVTRMVAAIVALPVSLMFVLLLALLGAAMIGTRTETLLYLFDLAFIFALLGIPAFFLWRHVFRSN